MFETDEHIERTEQPTEHRLQEARRRGQGAKSPDLTSAILVLGSALLLAILGPGLLRSMTSMTAGMLDFRRGEIWPAVGPALLYVAVLAGAMMALAVLANVFQTGLRPSTESLSPNWDRVSPLSGLRRLFSLRVAVRALWTVCKIAAVAMVCRTTIEQAVEKFASLNGSAGELATLAGELALGLMVRAGAVLLVLALLDYLYQRWQHQRDLKMTPRQVKEELKQSEGDPNLRSRRQQMQRRIGMQRLHLDVPKCCAVIAAPSGLSVAIRFVPPMRSPCVAAKGIDRQGKRMQEIAVASGVGVVEDKELALSLFKRCRVGQEIPQKHHEQVAEIIAYLRQAASTGQNENLDSLVSDLSVANG